MHPDALHLEVPELIDENSGYPTNLAAELAATRELPAETALDALLALLFRLNRNALTLLERQRVLQSFSDEYRFQAALLPADQPPSRLFVRFCNELANGYKRLVLQVLQGSREPSRQHLAWCLYMAQYFLSQAMLRHYQLYQEPSPAQWRDSHSLFRIGEQHGCLDEPISAPFQPMPAPTQRSLYQQLLLLALSNPFHLHNNEALLLYGALANYAVLPQLLPWAGDDDAPGLLVDLHSALPCQPLERLPVQVGDARRLELGMLLLALEEPSPLQRAEERALLEKVRVHWTGRQQRRHERTEQSSEWQMVAGLPAIHAQLLEQRPMRVTVRMIDGSPGGARLLCRPELDAQLPVGQLLLLLPGTGKPPLLALIRWRHHDRQGLHLGLRYLKGLVRPVWLRRAPSAQTHAGVLQSTPASGGSWHHGLWLPQGHFVEGENLWLQLPNVNNQTVVPLPSANLETASVIRHPLRMA